MAEQSCKQASRRASTSDLSLELVKKLKLESETKLTDLSYDCLYSIFKLLSLYQVTEMCDLSKKFVEPANWIIKEISGRLLISLRCHTWPLSQEVIFIPASGIKHIGPSLKNLHADLRWPLPFPPSRAVANAIVEHCTQLTELRLENSHIVALDSIKTPIAKLELLYLDNGFLGPIFSEFGKWFPQLRTLTVINCNVIDESCIDNMGVGMPALQSIHLNTLRKIDTDRLCNVDKIIKGNGHVKHFRFSSGKAISSVFCGRDLLKIE